MKGLLPKCTVLKVELLQDHQICSLQACLCALCSPKNLRAGAVKGLIKAARTRGCTWVGQCTGRGGLRMAWCGHCSGTTHTPSIAFQHLPPNSAGNGHATELRGHSALSPHSCAPTLSAPSESLGSKQAVEAT